MQIFWTVLAGVLVFLLGQIVLKSLIEPRQRLREAISRVAHVLLMYQASYANLGTGNARTSG